MRPALSLLAAVGMTATTIWAPSSLAQGIPADHIAAAGFADKQPLDPGTGEEAYRRNRRIELKLTER